MKKIINHLRGQQFELFCYKNFFKNFQIVEKSHDYSKNYPIIESNKNPDFKFRCRETKETFWIECKFNSIETVHDNYEIHIEKKQYFRYKKLSEPIFYMIGIDLEPNNVEEIFLIHIENVYFDKNFLNHVEKFKIKNQQIKNFNELKKLTKIP